MSPSDVPKNRKALLIENVFEKETSESYIERHFPNRSIHRAKDLDEYEVNRIIADYGEWLVRSTQELIPDPESSEYITVWTTLILRTPENVFWHFSKKTNSYGKDDNSYQLVVVAEDPKKAARDAIDLHKRYLPGTTGPSFFLLQDAKAKPIAVDASYRLEDAQLELYHGEGFAKWTRDFAAKLSLNGLSILRGKPGTGKTSFLRHLILSLSETHRFYYIPVDSFMGMHSRIGEFLLKEQRRHKDSRLVLVMEDAEQLLLDRRGVRDGLASSLLNLTDGFMSDMIKAHLICTVNSEFIELDNAVLRPGRQRAFREFHALQWPQAQKLAASLGTVLTEPREYTLAEIFHFKDLQSQDRLIQDERKIGFA